MIGFSEHGGKMEHAMSDLTLEHDRGALPGVLRAPQGLAAALRQIAEMPAALACAKAALREAADGATVAVGMSGRHVLGRFRAWRHADAVSAVNRVIAVDAQRAFERGTFAQREGREWLVHTPGSCELARMDEREFAAFQLKLAAVGGSLVTMVFTGESARHVAVTMCRFVGGVLHGDTADCPAVIRATEKGIDRTFFSRGRRLDGPCPADRPAEDAGAQPEPSGIRRMA